MASASRRASPPGRGAAAPPGVPATRIRGSSTCWITRRTLATIVDVLGPNIFMYHCHLDVHPPEDEPPRSWRWHQDGGIQNRDLETDPRPRLSLKVAFFLTDLRSPDRGNFLVVPGSHRAQHHRAAERRRRRRPLSRSSPRPATRSCSTAALAHARSEPIRAGPQGVVLRVHLPMDPAARRSRPGCDRRRALDARRSGSSWGSTTRPTSTDGCPTTRISPVRDAATGRP